MHDDLIGVDERTLDDLALEALAEAHETAPPSGLRGHVLAAARADRTTSKLRLQVTRWRMVGAVAATLALVAGSVLGGATTRLAERTRALQHLATAHEDLKTTLGRREQTLVSLQVSLDTQNAVLRVLSGPRTLSASLAPGTETFDGNGTVHLDAATGRGAVVLVGVRDLPLDKTYELWAIRGTAAPEPAGLLHQGGPGVFAATLTPVSDPASVTAFAVSIEPRAGSDSPTGPVVLVGPVAS